MQHRFDFLANDILLWRSRLEYLIADRVRRPARLPANELVKAMISSRTRDAVSLSAYEQLMQRFGTVPKLACALPSEVLPSIAEVTHAEKKALYLHQALRIVSQDCPDFDLDFLAAMPMHESLAWLEHLPGVGRKVAASVLNASTLALPVFIVDTHVLRVMRRLGAVRNTADYTAASEAVTSAMHNWQASDFLSFHDMVKRLGQMICIHGAPLCDVCPLSPKCPTGRRYSATSPRVS